MSTKPSSSSSSTRILSLKSSDNLKFDIKESVAMQSKVLKHMIEDECFEGGIPLLVTGKILSMVIDWCNKHQEEHKVNKEEMKTWEEEFINRLSFDDLHGILMASNYLNVKPLLDCGCQRAADLIKNKRPQEIREMFNIVDDYSAEEEAQIRQENAWTV